MKPLGILISLLFLSVNAKALREVEFEWEEIEGARNYQVEVKNNQTFLQKLNSSTYTFKIQIAPGKYQIRGRALSIGPQDTESDWSTWKVFDVPPGQISAIKLDKYEFKVSPHTAHSEIPLNWQAQDGAAEYIVQVTEVNTQAKQTFITKTPHAVLRLRPGYYTVNITAKTADGLESEPFALPQEIFVQNVPVEIPKSLVLDVDKGSLWFAPAKGTSTVVSLERQAFLGVEWNKIDQKVVTGNNFKWAAASLKPGKYRLTLYSKNSFGEVSQPVLKEFVVKPKEANLPPA